MEKDKMSPLDRFIGLLQLEKKDVTQVLFYAIFAGVVSLSLPLGVQQLLIYFRLHKLLRLGCFWWY